MKKVFISLPMHGLPESVVLARMNELHKRAQEVFKEPLEMIDTYHKDFVATGENPRLQYLGDSIMKMADADYAYFANDFSKAKGCVVEWEVAHIYRIPHEIDGYKAEDSYTIHIDSKFKAQIIPEPILGTRMINCLKRNKIVKHSGPIVMGDFDGLNVSSLISAYGFGMKMLQTLLEYFESINDSYGESIISYV